MHSRISTGILLTVMTASGFFGTRPAAAQFITFDTPQTISGDTDVSTSGALVGAYDFSSNSTVNTVPFANTPNVGGGSLSISVSGGANNVNGNSYGSTAAPYSSLSSAYQTLLMGAQHGDNGSSGAPVTYTMSNLNAGEMYQVQYFVNDSRGGYNGRTDTITSTGGNSQTLHFATTSTNGGLGQYAVGRFTAASTAVTFSATGNASTQVNALQFRDLGNAGAPITFSAPTAITTADATLGLAGTVVSATAFGAGANTVTLTGGQVINFADGKGSSASAAVVGGNGTFTGAFSGNTGNTDFNTVLNGANYDGATTSKQVQLSGLTVGQQYSVQLFALDDRGLASGRTFSFSDFSGNTSTSLESANNYILGTFTALSSYETINEANGGVGNLNVNINAVVVRAISAAPEPSALSSLGLAIGGLLCLMLKARKSCRTA